MEVVTRSEGLTVSEEKLLWNKRRRRRRRRRREKRKGKRKRKRREKVDKEESVDLGSIGSSI